MLLFIIIKFKLFCKFIIFNTQLSLLIALLLISRCVYTRLQCVSEKQIFSVFIVLNNKKAKKRTRTPIPLYATSTLWKRLVLEEVKYGRYER